MRLEFRIAAAAAFASIALAADAQYALNPAESGIAEYLAGNETEAFLGGSDSVIGQIERIDASVTVKDVVTAYRKNEVAGDQTYFDKRIVLRGSVEAIKSGLGNTPYLVLDGGKSLNPQAELVRGNNEAAAKLQRGAKISLVCVGAGSIAGTPMFRKCEFASDVAARTLGKFAQDVDDFFAGKSGPKPVAQWGTAIVALAELVPASAGCPKNYKSCGTAIRKATSDKQSFQAAMEAAADKLKSNGLQVPSATPDP